MNEDLERLLAQNERLVDSIIEDVSNSMKEISEKVQHGEVTNGQILQFLTKWDSNLELIKTYLHQIKNEKMKEGALTASFIRLIDKFGDVLSFGGKKFFSSPSSAITMCAVILMASTAILNLLGVDIHGLIPNIMHGVFGG